MVSPEWNTTVNLKAAQVLHCDIGTLDIFCLLQQFYNSGLVPGWPQRFYMLARPGLFPQQMKGFNSKSTSLFVPLTPVMLKIQV